MHRIPIVDSHTGGEPTRVVISGGPDLGTGSLAERAKRFTAEFDRYRSAIVNEPRGSDVVVGALLCTTENSAAACGVIFFNNVGMLGMCGHGTIGVIETLKHIGRIQAGAHILETPVGDVTATLHSGGQVSVANVVSRRTQAAVTLDVPGVGLVTGDVAWGGNWFFLVSEHQEKLTLSNIERLLFVTQKIRATLTAQNITGDDGTEIDHIELFGPPANPQNHSRNFVLCPGGAYDRSPCGTGTSAKLACLAASGKLASGQVWRQESILGSVFEGVYEPAEGGIRPTITGTAHITAEATLLISDTDPFAWGIHS